MRQLAGRLKDDHPEMGMHQHLRDAASALERGATQAAQRHLTAAIGNAAPQSLYRHGITSDADYHRAKLNMDAVHRHLLLVKDIADDEDHNNSLPRASDFPEQGTPTSPLAAVPTGQQPGGARALPTGGPDASVAMPQKVTGPATRQVAASRSGGRAIDLSLFNPLERRNARGEWDRAGAADAIEKAYARHKVDRVPGYRASAPALVMAGRVHEAADEIDGNADRARSPGDASALRRMAGQVRSAPVNDTSYVHKEEAALGFEPDATTLSAAHGKSNDDLENDAGFHTSVPANVDPQAQEAARRELLDRTIVGNYRPPSKLRMLSDLQARDPRAAASVTKAHKDLQAQWGKVSRAYGPMMADQRTRSLPGVSTSWGDAERAALDLSADTARLAATPAPRGKPGGPGLYNVKGNMHSPYFQQVVKALIEKRGMPPGKAYPIAWAALRKWERGGGHVHPEVRAAAAGSLALEKVAEARAHAHANATWDDVCAAIELTGTAAGSAKDSRNVLGQYGSGGQQAQKGQQAKGKQPTAHQKHMAHLSHLKVVAQKRSAMLSQARNDRARANTLIAQRNAMMKALASASGKVTTGQAGSKTTAKASTTASNAPAATTTAAKTTTATTTAAKKTTATAARPPASAAQLRAGIATLNTQISQLQAQAAQLTAQAARLK
jgi:hypothetical protein